MTKRFSAVLALGFSLLASLAAAQTPAEPREEFYRARVVEIVEEEEDATATTQQVRLRLLSGPDKGQEYTVQNDVPAGRENLRIEEGEKVVARKIVRGDGESEYSIAEKYRLPALGVLFLSFFVLTFLLCGRKGLQALLGLGVSILIIVLYVIPSIVRGANPTFTSLAGAVLIASTSLYLAHGFSKRTSVVFLSTVITLGIATVLAEVSVGVAKLFGMGTEEAMYLQFGALQDVDLRGLLLGGIIIGALGVLDDVTSAQTVAVDEIRRANPSLSPAQLRQAGLNVGREHMVSMINTLALAYAGASFPLLLLFTLDGGFPLWVTLNGEFIAEEIVRTLVGSSALLFAVPVSAYLAAVLLPKWVPVRKQ